MKHSNLDTSSSWTTLQLNLVVQEHQIRCDVQSLFPRLLIVFQLATPRLELALKLIMNVLLGHFVITLKLLVINANVTLLWVEYVEDLDLQDKPLSATQIKLFVSTRMFAKSQI